MSANLTITHKATWEGGQIETQKDFAEDDGVYTHVPPLDVAGSTTDKEVVVAIDVSQIKELIIKASVDMTLETNDGTTPDNTIALKANFAYVWAKDYSYDTCKLTVDVTKLYLTNAGATAGTFELLCVYDSTP